MDNGGGSNTTYLFRTNKTEQYFIESLPDVNFDFGEMYSGSIPINYSAPDDGALFFFFKPKIGATEKVEEVTIWLNGGPGCSSLMGFLQESGPISWQPGTYSPTKNEYTWANLTNVLWVDQPIGTGFSMGTPYATSEEDIAGPFLEWFMNWQDEFGISNYKIYVTGESYAGKYVPYIASAMVDANDTNNFDVDGILLYDPCISEYNVQQNEIPAYPFIQANWNLFGFNESFMGQLKEIHESCGYQDYIDKCMVFPASGVQPPLYFNFSDPANATCDVYLTAFTEAFNVNPCFNEYEVNSMCPVLFDPLGNPGSLLYVPEGFTIYFQRPDVMAAIHAPPNVTWEECSSAPGVLPKVIEKTNKVLVTNSDFDYSSITNGTLLAIQNMTWAGHLGFQTAPTDAFVITQPDVQYAAGFNASGLEGLNGPQGQLGWYHHERGLMWASVWQAGHMGPNISRERRIFTSSGCSAKFMTRSHRSWRMPPRISATESATNSTAA